MLSFNLEPIFMARGISKPYSFLVNAGISPNCAHNIISSNTRVLRLDHIELLCKALICEPNDLLLWEPETGERYAENFPLSKLKQANSVGNFQETFATMSFQQLKQMAEAIREGGKTTP